MELKEFVTQTLIQIIEGVKEAQEQTKESGALINPKTWATTGVIASSENNIRNIQTVKMDVAVTVVENSSSKAGIGVVASVFKAGVSNEGSDGNTKTSRIEFNIPISFPVPE